MYSILQAQAKNYILGEILIANSEIVCKGDNLCVVYGDIVQDSLEQLIFMNKVRGNTKEVLTQVLKIYGMNVEHNDYILYKTPAGKYDELICNIRIKRGLPLCKLNNLSLKYDDHRVLLLMLCDPLKFIQLMDSKIRLSHTNTFFDTLYNSINKTLANLVATYFYMRDLVSGGILYRDVVNMIITSYIRILSKN